MFDSQKINFDDWLLGYKHGTYVFTSDSCHLCQEYKKSIEYINNHYLYFVEVNTEKQKEVLSKTMRRSALPMTACYKDNNLQFVRLGQLFDLQMKEILEFLKDFPKEPLTKQEILEKIEDAKKQCKFAYYLFTQTTTEDERQKIIQKSFGFHEIPVDIERISPNLDKNDRIKQLKGEIPFVKLVIFKDGRSSAVSEFGQAIMMEFANLKSNPNANQDTFVVRMIPEVLNDNNNSN